MSTVQSVLGASLQILDFPYWAVKLRSRKWLCELDLRLDSRSGVARPFDWTLDLVDTGDIKNVVELWLLCPPSAMNPRGNTARLPIIESGTAFQLKINSLDGFGTMYKSMESILIGRVDDKTSGDCTCFIWDAGLRVMSQPWKSSVYHIGSWREGIAPIGAISHAVMGLELK